MPADLLTHLQASTAQARSRFSRQYPHLLTELTLGRLKPPLATPREEQALPTATSLAVQKRLTTITDDEFQTIMSKLQDTAQLHAGNLDHDLELYLEQQLADLFGFEITTEMNGNRLPATIGVIESLPHRKRTPTDTPLKHERVHEAGFSEQRSFFGWQQPGNFTTTPSITAEEYGIALPIIDQLGTAQSTVAQWYKRTKLLVLNPFEYRAVVAQVCDSYQPLNPKYQFAGTPELIRDGRCWSPRTNGRVLVFFLPDESNQLSLGPVTFFAQN